MRNEKGAALVIAVIVMGLLAALIVGLSTNADIDLLVGRNARILKQAFEWSDSGLELAQDMIQDSENYPNHELDYKLRFGSYEFDVNGTNTIYNSTNSSITLKDNNSGTIATSIFIRQLGSIVNDGSSIIFASGYEGAGKGAGAGGTIARIYSIHSSGFAESNSTKRSAEIYRSVSTGK